MILGVGNDVQDALVRQTIGLGPYLSFPRVDNVPVQWVQLLNGFEQQDLYGWPLLTPLKVQMQKCDKCSQEFCSTVNYRRHIRVHRRLNVDKETYKNRDSLRAFWDKVSVDEAKNILSFEDVILEGVSGSSIVKALVSFVRSPGFCALPQVYVKAGHLLLDVIEATPSRLSISSQEFFNILDDASERTFLCGGTGGPVQKFIFDGEAGKVGLELRNLVACTSFLVEQNLVKAWIADKDAEALRCQKLLVEEEEASQRRQAELLERKRLKKLRQKEQKTKGRSCKETTKSTGAADILEKSEGDLHASSSPTSPTGAADILEKSEKSEGDLHASSSPTSAADILEKSKGDLNASSSPPEFEGDLHALEVLNSTLADPVHFFNNEVNGHTDNEVNGHTDIEGGYNSELLYIGTAKNVELPENQDDNNQHTVDIKAQVLESPSEQKTSALPKDVAPVNSNEIGTRIVTVENNRECVSALLDEGEISQTGHTSCEVMIGSIAVTMRKCITHKQDVGSHSQSEYLQDSYSIDRVKCENVGAQDKHKQIKPNHVKCGNLCAQDKLIKPESPMSNTILSDVQNGVIGVGTIPGKFSLGSPEVDNDTKQNDFIQPGKLVLSSHSARAFLSQRWKEAISGDHETLVLFEEPERQGHFDATNECSDAIHSKEGSILGSAENRLGVVEPRLGVVEPPEYPTNKPVDPKQGRKPKKGYLIKVQC